MPCHSDNSVRGGKHAGNNSARGDGLTDIALPVLIRVSALSLVHADVADDLFDAFSSAAFAKHVCCAESCLGELIIDMTGQQAGDTAHATLEDAACNRGEHAFDSADSDITPKVVVPSPVIDMGTVLGDKVRLCIAGVNRLLDKGVVVELQYLSLLVRGECTGLPAGVDGVQREACHERLELRHAAVSRAGQRCHNRHHAAGENGVGLAGVELGELRIRDKVSDRTAGCRLCVSSNVHRADVVAGAES